MQRDVALKVLPGQGRKHTKLRCSISDCFNPSPVCLCCMLHLSQDFLERYPKSQGISCGTGRPNTIDYACPMPPCLLS